MKAFITPAYTFTPGAPGVGTLNLSGVSGFEIKRLVAVINQTAGKLIYSTGNEALRFTALAGTTLTLNADTATQNSADVLQVIYESPDTFATQATLASLLTELQLKADLTETQPVSGPLTDAQLRATALPVSGPLTDAQLRATSVPVSMASAPSPAISAGAITHTQKAVGVTAVRATVDGLAPSASRKKLILKSSADNTGRIYFGSSAVTIANGVEIVGPDRLEFEFDSGDYYVISDIASQKVEILEKV